MNHSLRFVFIVALFITCLIAANITAVKLVTLFGLLLPAAIIIFPVSYILGDVLTEVYGYRQARKVIWLGFLCNLIVVAAIWFGQLLPAAFFYPLAALRSACGARTMARTAPNQRVKAKRSKGSLSPRFGIIP
ncbi:MAG: queuosine precursor transporter [Kiloniellales bacterium]